MRCSECQCEQNRPLETYDGRLWCEKCHAPLTRQVPKFAFTVNGEKLFKLSEIFYFRYLEGAASTVEFSPHAARTNNLNAEKTEEFRDLLEKAVAYCTEAAEMGDPRAVERLAYYYDMDLAEPDRSKALRRKIAADHYYAVCCCVDPVDKMSCDAACQRMTGEEWKALQSDAARRMMRLLCAYSDKVPGYEDLNKVRNDIRERSGIDVELPDDAVDIRPDALTIVTRMLNACQSATRAPLVGMYKVSKADLKRLFGDENGIARKMLKLSKKKLYMRLFEADKGGKSDRASWPLTEMGGVKDAIKDLNGDAYIMILNTMGQHALGHKAKKVKKLFQESDDGSAISQYAEGVIRGCPGGCTIYDDDIIVHMNQGPLRGVKAAADKFYENMIKG